MAKEKFERGKPQILVKTIGSSDGGKKTLTAAIEKVLRDVYGEQVASLGPSGNEIRVVTSDIGYASAAGRRISRKHKLRGPGSSESAHGAILVVSATDGPGEWTRREIHMARCDGVPRMAVFLNKADMVDDEGSIVRVKEEVRALLSEHSFAVDAIPFVAGSALKALEGDPEHAARILELGEHLSTWVDQVDAPPPFAGIAPVEDAHGAVDLILERTFHFFRLILDGVELDDTSVDALLASGCEDASFGIEQGVKVAEFHRQHETFETAVLEAIAQIEGARVGAVVVRVEPDELLTASGLAERLDRTRQSISQLVTGVRGAGDFPPPITTTDGKTRLWRWTDVIRWFGPALNDDPERERHAHFVAALNGSLEMRRYLESFKDLDGPTDIVRRIFELGTGGSSGNSAASGGESGGGSSSASLDGPNAPLSLLAERACRRLIDLAESAPRELDDPKLAEALGYFSRAARAQEKELIELQTGDWSGVPASERLDATLGMLSTLSERKIRPIVIVRDACDLKVIDAGIHKESWQPDLMFRRRSLSPLQECARIVLGRPAHETVDDLESRAWAVCGQIASTQYRCVESRAQSSPWAARLSLLVSDSSCHEYITNDAVLQFTMTKHFHRTAEREEAVGAMLLSCWVLLTSLQVSFARGSTPLPEDIQTAGAEIETHLAQWTGWNEQRAF